VLLLLLMMMMMMMSDAVMNVSCACKTADRWQATTTTTINNQPSTK
jgi:hypothetical protein